MAKADRFLALVVKIEAAYEGKEFPSVLASSEYPYNPDGTMKNPKTFEYQIKDLHSPDEWSTIQVSRHSDEFDAAEDAVEKEWQDSGETPPSETSVNVREFGKAEYKTYIVGVEFNPTFTAREAEPVKTEESAAE